MPVIVNHCGDIHHFPGIHNAPVGKELIIDLMAFLKKNIVQHMMPEQLIRANSAGPVRPKVKQILCRCKTDCFVTAVMDPRSVGIDIFEFALDNIRVVVKG